MLKIGAGQSSIVLDALRTAGRVASLTTLEHDPQWAEAIRARVSHEIAVAPLLATDLHGVRTQTYDFKPDTRFDCIIVDGPVGIPHHSRWGTLKLLQESLNEDFVIIFDDAERPGERQTITKFLSLRPEASHIFVHAAKSQCVVFSEKYRIVGSY